jgi:hypothetical protein
LQNMSTGESGGSRGSREYLVGPEALRANATTADTTSTNLDPFGVSRLSSAGGTFTIDPPIPGVTKTIAMSSGTVLSVGDDQSLFSSAGSSHTTITTSAPAVLELVGLSSALWLLKHNGANLGLTT